MVADNWFGIGSWGEAQKTQKIISMQLRLYHEFICKERARNRGIKERRERESSGLWGMVYTNLPTSQRFCCCSVAQLCPTLCYPMDCSTPCFPVLHRLPEFAQIHVHWVSDAIQPLSSPSLIPFSSLLQSFPASGSFPMSQFFASGGQSIGASASASVLQMNIQDWFPVGLTDLISFQSKGLSKIFSNTTVQKHRFFGFQPSLWSNFHICIWLLEKP